MKLQEILIAAVQRSEIPLRFEPGAEEAVVRPVIEVLHAWVLAHVPEATNAEFDAGRRALALQLLSEVDGSADLPE
jgi:hypothetical protein